MRAAGARRSLETGSDTSYYERETWDEWGSRSSLSQQEEVGTHSPAREDAASLRAERDALARALAGERQRAASAARAHDARLAELHGVIAELVRRRAHDKQARAIPEEDVSDECESTTQPAGDLENDADHSRTEQSVDMAYQQESSEQQDLPYQQEPSDRKDVPYRQETNRQDVPYRQDTDRKVETDQQATDREAYRDRSYRRDRPYESDAMHQQEYEDTETDLDTVPQQDNYDQDLDTIPQRETINLDRAYPQGANKLGAQQEAAYQDRALTRGAYDSDTPSAVSPELPTPLASAQNDLTSDVDSSPQEYRADRPRLEVTTPSAGEGYDTSLNLSERESDGGHATTRQYDESGGSCERERGSPESPRLYTSADRIEARQAKVASRVRLRRTEDTDASTSPGEQSAKCTLHNVHEALDILEAQQHGNHDGLFPACPWAARALRLRAERRVLRCALARAADTARRLYCACALHESTSVSLCCALRAADRALEVYDVLLALAETSAQHSHEREATELVARQLLARLDDEHSSASIGEPLLSPGPWLQHHNQVSSARWSPACESRLRAHAARLKADTVALRDTQPQPKLFSYHDVDESELGTSGPCSSAEMEEAVAIHDALVLPHTRTHSTHNTHSTHTTHNSHSTHNTRSTQAQGGSSSTLGGRKEAQEEKRGSPGRGRRSRPRHWLDARGSETDL